MGTTGENIEYTNPSSERLSSPRIFAVVLDKMKNNDLVNPQIKTSESEMTQVKDGINVISKTWIYSKWNKSLPVDKKYQ